MPIGSSAAAFHGRLRDANLCGRRLDIGICDWRALAAAVKDAVTLAAPSVFAATLPAVAAPPLVFTSAASAAEVASSSAAVLAAPLPFSGGASEGPSCGVAVGVVPPPQPAKASRAMRRTRADDSL